MPLRPATADQIQPIHVRQAQIDDEAVVNFLAGKRQRRLGVNGGVDLIAGFAQAAMQKVPYCRIVFNYQQSQTCLAQQIGW